MLAHCPGLHHPGKIYYRIESIIMFRVRSDPCKGRRSTIELKVTLPALKMKMSLTPKIYYRIESDEELEKTIEDAYKEDLL